MKRVVALSLASLAGLLTAAPGLAQDSAAGPEPKVNQLIIYGDDKCPESTGDEITVCARMDESERYRIPKDLRSLDGPKNQSWANKVRSFETVGNFGPLSCTPIGAGGELGCTAKMIAAAYAEKAQSPDHRFAELIAQERAKRLSTIDEQAAATQARVQAIEAERARLQASGLSPAQAAAQAEQNVVDRQQQGQPAGEAAPAAAPNGQ